MGSKLILSVVVIFCCIVKIKGGALRVVGGDEAPRNFGRFHVSLQNLTGHHVCGGAVVSERYIVTAAHCVEGAFPEYIKAVVGTTDLSIGGLQYDVLSITAYSEFNFNLRTNDIALLKVDGTFDLRNAEVVKLYDQDLVEGDPIILSGFGSREVNGESSQQMHILNLTVFNQETCIFAMRYNRAVTNSMFCTFTQIGQGTCHGDSGSPLVKDNQLVGLVSWGIPCAVGFPDVHTRIYPFLSWIKEEIQK